MKWLGRVAGLTVAFVVATGMFVGAVYADSLESSHYKFVETDLGGGGLVPSYSAHYQSAQSTGDTAIGNAKSTNFQTEAGSQTTADPALSFSINNASASFGSFSPTATATATSQFSVSNYTSYGYTVQIVGDTPHNGSHTIPAMATDAQNPTIPSQPGTEQFGINLVKNTLPDVFGADPDHGEFGVGSPAPNYSNPNQFRFVSGETIATSPKSSGVTTYTISYIINVSGLTPGGHYTSKQALVCTGTF